jgi:hypothetical protein
METNLKHIMVLSAALFFAVLASSSVATADDHTYTPPTPVGPLTAAITQLNYDESGGTVNGFLVGANVLLTFSKPVCGGIGTLGAVPNTVTYSGLAETFTSGFQTVNVTSFKNGNITYPPATTVTKPSAYPLTAGAITQLNYNPDNGAINGFLFTPKTGPEVFVYIGSANATLTPLLTVGASLSVAGTMEGPGFCAPIGTVSEVFASSLTIGTKVYKVGGLGFVPFLP